MNPETPEMNRASTTGDSIRETDALSTEPRKAPEPLHGAPLLSRELSQRLQSEWSEVETSFVGEPRQAVQKADELVAFAIKQIAETFAHERPGLESQWDRDGEVSTEGLRAALVHYRSFFHRLLAI